MRYRWCWVRMRKRRALLLLKLHAWIDFICGCVSVEMADYYPILIRQAARIHVRARRSSIFACVINMTETAQSEKSADSLMGAIWDRRDRLSGCHNRCDVDGWLCQSPIHWRAAFQQHFFGWISPLWRMVIYRLFSWETIKKGAKRQLQHRIRQRASLVES